MSQSISAKKKWAKMSSYRKALMSKKISDTLKLYYANMSQEEKALFAEKRKKALTPDVKKRIAGNVSAFLQSNPDAIENLRIKGGNASRKYHSTKTKEERDRRALAISKGVTNQWASYTEEQRRQHVLNSLKGVAVRPTKPEIILNDYLDAKFPGEWKYNGDCSESIIIGGKVPDFVNVNGKKAVIECFGLYWHNPIKFPKRSSFEQLKSHYSKYGFSCVIIWEDECNDVDLNRILSEVY